MPARDRVEWITDQRRLAAIEGPWNRLADEEEAPFGQHAWFAAWWDAFGEGELRVCALWRGEELSAVFPLWQGRKALHGMANVHTPLFQAPAVDNAAREAVVSAALEAVPATLEVIGLPATDPWLGALVRGSQESGQLVAVEPLHTSPIVELEGSYDEYRRRTRPHWLGRIAAYGRKMRRDHDAEFALVEEVSDLDRELERCFLLEAAGWKGNSGTAILSTDETARFYTALAQACHDLDQLRLSRITLDGRLVAFELCLLYRDRLWPLKGAYDERFRRLSPGMVLLLSEIERCFEMGLDAVELLGDRDPYKVHFATTQREHRGFRAYRRRPAPMARYSYRRWGRPLLKRVYRGTVARPRGLA